MTPSHETGFTRLVAVARRRRWTVIPITLIVAGIGVLLVWRLPHEYRARAVVRFDDPRPARDYVQPTVTEPGVDRLKSRRIGFLTRPLVTEAARRVGFPTDERNIDELASHLDARPEGDDAFILSFTHHDPAQAKAFLGALTEAYAEQRAREASEQASETATFFQKEVDSLRPRVGDADVLVEKWKAQHYGALPEQLEGNLRMLDEVQMETAALVASIDAAKSRRASIIADVDSPLRRQEEEAARAVTVARARYAPDSDEVKNLDAELERVRAARAQEEGDNGRRARRSLEVRQAEGEIARATGRLDELRGRERDLTQRIEAAAKNGEVLARLVLDRDILRDQLKSLVDKQGQAQLAAGLEAGVVGKARFMIVEPAWATLGPVAPPRAFLTAAAVVLGLLAGLGVGLFLEATDRRVRLVADVKRMTGAAPVLGVVPRLSRGAR